MDLALNNLQRLICQPTNQNEAIFILFRANIFEKVMNPTILLQPTYPVVLLLKK